MNSLRLFQRRHLKLSTKWTTVLRAFSQVASAQEVVIVSSARTPIGSFQGQLSSLSGPQLGACAIKAAIDRAGVSGQEIEDVYMGSALQMALGQSPTRQAAIFAGLSETTEATMVNKACASGMKAIMLAAQNIMVGHRNVMVAGGMESMSNAPYILHREGVRIGNVTLHDTLFHDGLGCPFNKGLLMGHCAENTNRKMGISRQDQDDFCLGSYAKARQAWETGVYKDQVVPVTVTHKTEYGPKSALPDWTTLNLGPRRQSVVAEDEEYKKLKPENVSRLRPIFEEEGTVTAANASKNSDGACALVLMSAKDADRLKLKPLARIVSFADAATAPIDYPLAPSMGIRTLLQQTGIHRNDVSIWEINEAFSTVVLATNKILDLDPSKVNPHGGAVSLGHPLGSSGARLVAQLAHTLQPGQYGVASICNAGGASSSLMVQRL